MYRTTGIWLGVVVICGCLVGCGEPTERLNAPPQGQAEKCNRMRPFFTYMGDNEMLSDMCIADIHFVPHTVELNSLGAARLSRMAKLLEPYGGTIRYATESKDEDMVDKRIEHVRDFLAAIGADLDRIELAVAMAGAAHTPADQAIEAKAKGMASTFEEDAGTEQ
jgi:hypothetical protein